MEEDLHVLSGESGLEEREWARSYQGDGRRGTVGAAFGDAVVETAMGDMMKLETD